jgi:hypothetical protein
MEIDIAKTVEYHNFPPVERVEQQRKQRIPKRSTKLCLLDLDCEMGAGCELNDTLAIIAIENYFRVGVS